MLWIYILICLMLATVGFGTVLYLYIYYLDRCLRPELEQRLRNEVYTDTHLNEDIMRYNISARALGLKTIDYIGGNR